MKFQARLAIFCGCTAWFVSDLVENPEDQFSHNEAHIFYHGVVPLNDAIGLATNEDPDQTAPLGAV